MSGIVDLNTLPANMIKRIEILQDGASAVYGSDAIGGVVNVITNSDFEGFKVDGQYGEYLSEGDGSSAELAILFGGLFYIRTICSNVKGFFFTGDIQKALF